MQPFEQYLKDHHLEALTISVKAQVRYITVWKAVKGNPITAAHAQKIRQAVLDLTGIPYTGQIVIIQEQSFKWIKPLHIKTVKRHSR